MPNSCRNGQNNWRERDQILGSQLTWAGQHRLTHSPQTASAGTWHNVVGIFNGSNEIVVYVDGVKHAQVRGAINPLSNQGDLYIGTVKGIGRLLRANLDDVAIFG